MKSQLAETSAPLNLIRLNPAYKCNWREEVLRDRLVGVHLMPLGRGGVRLPPHGAEHCVRGIKSRSLGSSSSFPLEKAASPQRPLTSLGSSVFPTSASFGSVPKLCVMMGCPLSKGSTVPQGEVFVLPL